MKLVVRHGGGELTVPSQSEFLILYQRGFVGPEDLVRREGAPESVQWVPAGELPWIKGAALDEKRDISRLFKVTLVLMVLGLIGVFYIQARASKIAKAPRPSAAAPSSPAAPAADPNR